MDLGAFEQWREACALGLEGGWPQSLPGGRRSYAQSAVLECCERLGLDASAMDVGCPGKLSRDDAQPRTRGDEVRSTHQASDRQRVQKVQRFGHEDSLPVGVLGRGIDLGGPLRATLAHQTADQRPACVSEIGLNTGETDDGAAWVLLEPGDPGKT